jgi:hypothetical protein
MAKKITAFAEVFEQRLKITEKSLKKELEKTKGERRREVIKNLICEIKGLKETLKEIKPKCRHCGGEL